MGSTDLKSAPISRVEVSVERLRPNDAAEVHRLIQAVIRASPYYSDAAKHAESQKYGPQALRDLSAADPDAVLVARVRDEVVGFCISKVEDTLVWLSWFGVRSDVRRQGVGLALLHALNETVRLGRSHKVWCDCRTDNVDSIRALERSGYRRLCTLLNHWYGHDYLLLECPRR